MEQENDVIRKTVTRGPNWLGPAIPPGELHRAVGGYPGPSHKVPVCCRAMRSAMENGDREIESPPSGSGASLTVEYRLPQRGASSR